jgi:hypothetical protein
MTTSPAVLSGRRLAEHRMHSECTVFATGGEQVTDPITGEVTTTPEVVYSGRCAVRPGGSGTVTIAGIELPTADFVVDVPFDATGITEGHRVTVTASPDLEAAGLTGEIQTVPRGDHLTCRELACRRVAL